jgi:hypothetical protein
MNTANQVVALDRTIRHQRTAVRTPAIQYTYGIIVTHDHKVNVSNQGVCRLPVFQFIPVCNCGFVH